MPHTSRRKKHPSQQHKRLEITDSSGWTHVTTSGNARRLNNRRDHNPNQDSISEPQQQQQKEVEPPLSPAEAPPSVTLSHLQRQLNESRRRWESSATWASAQGALRRALPLTGSRGEGEDVSIVCVGLGSPSGFLRGGWVDRRSVSMYQLAALASAMELFENQTPSRLVKVYAQDPVFNDHDRDLLESLNITVLEHPGAFDKVSSRTLLFCPGAERRHLELLLAHDPAIVFGGPLEDIDSGIVTGFIRARESVQLPLFEEQEHAFWRMRVYYTPSERG
ncbi:hypothetical protein BJX68DRAFT_234886 [Aspergillus pseudodeflectus]|uniref:SRR1-like domain-containing protein n=1 Tax=Aspergillus pseudodeflectus TaxID=176178 RepID=A0ABR4KIQ4_9EURO